jgi:hypothetical protein
MNARQNQRRACVSLDVVHVFLGYVVLDTVVQAD